MTNQQLFEEVIKDMKAIKHWTPIYGWIKHTPSYAYMWCRISDYTEYHTDILSRNYDTLQFPENYKKLREWEKDKFNI